MGATGWNGARLVVGRIWPVITLVGPARGYRSTPGVIRYNAPLRASVPHRRDDDSFAAGGGSSCFRHILNGRILSQGQALREGPGDKTTCINLNLIVCKIPAASDYIPVTAPSAEPNSTLKARLPLPKRSTSMASTALVGVGGGLSLCLAAASSCSSTSASFARRAGGYFQRYGRRLVLLRRGGAGGERTRRQNCPIFHCANEVNVMTEDDSVDSDATDDEADLEAAADDTIDADGDTEDELESSLPEDVEWIKQQPLPYPLDALEPYISKETVEQHWGVHQQMHVDRLNSMIGGSEWEGMSLGQMMLSSFNEGREQPHPPFFHAAQVWNHDFYWRSMKPGGGGKPPERLLKFINRDFGSYEHMIQQFMDAALTQFGSGWVWLSYKGSKLPYVKSRSPIPSDNYGRLVISKTPNAINPLVWGHSPLLAIDVWEHAYYLDYEDRRGDYVAAILEKLVSWEVVESRLTKAVVRAVERDGHLSRRILRKRQVAKANGQSRARPRTQKGRLTGRQGDHEVASSSPVEA